MKVGFSIVCIFWCIFILSPFLVLFASWRVPASTAVYFSSPDSEELEDVPLIVAWCPEPVHCCCYQSLLLWLAAMTWIHPSSNKSPVWSLELPPTTSSRWDQQSYYLEAKESDLPAAEICDGRMLQLYNHPMIQMPDPTQRETGGSVGAAWLIWRFAQTTGSMF